MGRRSAVLLPLLWTAVILITARCHTTRTTLVVGTSLDWEPFGYIAEDGSYAGFDIELMEEIGTRLNLNIEWREHPFHMLIDLLVNGELDVAVAALNPTPERAARVDFTEPYFTRVDAALVARDSDLIMSTEQDLAEYRIGVLAGTVQESRIVATGDAEVRPYDRAAVAIAALDGGAVEVLVMDYFAARSYIDQNAVALAFKSEVPDDAMAIAVSKEDHTLRDQLSKTIAELQAESFVEALAIKHFAQE